MTQEKFKKTKLMGQLYAYPFPVIKGKKILILLKNVDDFVILNQSHNYFSVLKKIGVHSDGKTPVFELINSENPD